MRGYFIKSLSLSLLIHGILCAGAIWAFVPPSVWKEAKIHLLGGGSHRARGFDHGDIYNGHGDGMATGENLPTAGLDRPMTRNLPERLLPVVESQSNVSLLDYPQYHNLQPSQLSTIGIGNQDISSIRLPGQSLPAGIGNGHGGDAVTGEVGKTGSGSGGTGKGYGTGSGNGQGDGTGIGTGQGHGSGDGIGNGEGGLAPGFGMPEYPTESRRRGEEGTVVLSVEILANGTHGSISIVTSSGFSRLDQAAIAALENARYTPARLNHQPVNSTKIFPIRFKLLNPA